MCLVFALEIAPASAQTSVTLEGRVREAGTDSDIQNALVTLEGYGSKLTSTSGQFRFDGVDPGARVLRVRALGYADVLLRFTLEADMTLHVPMDIAPIEVDSLQVQLESVDIDGRVTDPATGIGLSDARVLSSQGHDVWVDVLGNFDLNDVHEGVPLRILIRAFGYLELDTTFVPDAGRRHDFAPEVDPLIQGIIELQADRLETLTIGRRAVTRSIERDDALDFAATFTVYDMLLSEYGGRLERVRCLVVDEEQISPRHQDWPTYLGTMLPEEVERVDFLFRGSMLRIYTRDFIKRMSLTAVTLNDPTYVDGSPGEPLCR